MSHQINCRPTLGIVDDEGVPGAHLSLVTRTWDANAAARTVGGVSHAG